MQQFFADYGLWLLVGLLIVIAIVFLVTRSGKADIIEREAIDIPPIVPSAIVGDLPIPLVVDVASAPVEAATITNAPTHADDLLRIKGVGPKLNSLLITLGVTRFDQIANWTAADLASVDAQLGTFRGRPTRDQWIDQAQYLATGDIAGFEAKYGKL